MQELEMALQPWGLASFVKERSDIYNPRKLVSYPHTQIYPHSFIWKLKKIKILGVLAYSNEY